MVHDLSDAPTPVDRVEDLLLLCVDDENEIVKRVAAVQEHTGGTAWEAFQDADRVGQTQRDVTGPAVAVPRDHLTDRITAVGNEAMAGHRTSPQFHRGVLFALG